MAPTLSVVPPAVTRVPPNVPASAPAPVITSQSRGRWQPSDPGDLWMKYAHIKDRAKRAIAFIEGEVYVTSGRGAGALYRLLPYQKTIIRRALDVGTLEAILSMPRGAGKSGIIAALLVFFLFDRPFANVIVMGTGMRTSRISYGRAEAAIKWNPRLMGQCRIFTGTADPHIEIPHRQASLWALPAKESSIVGQAASEAIIDEAGYVDEEEYEAIASGMGKVEGGLLIATGTPGLSAVEDDRHNPMYKRRLLARGEWVDEDGVTVPPPDGLLYMEHTAPISADISKPATWKKANPGLGILVGQREVAKDYATLSRNEFRQMRLGQWVQAEHALIEEAQWDALPIVTGPITPGTTITLGFDGAVSIDACALWAYELGTRRLVRIGYWSRPPGDRDWSMPRAEIIATIEDAFATYNVIAMYADPWFWREALQYLAERLGEDRVVEFNSAAPSRMAPATDAFTAAVRLGQIVTDGDAILRAHALSTVGRLTRVGTVIAKDARHIQTNDAFVAAMLAYEAGRTVPAWSGY